MEFTRAIRALNSQEIRGAASLKIARTNANDFVPGVLRFSNFTGTFLPPQDEDRRVVGSGVTTATLPVFSRPGFTKDGESSVLGFANALSPYIRLDLSVCGPRNVVGGPLVFLVPLALLLRPSEPPSPYLSLTNIASLRVSLAVSPLSLAASICLSSLSLLFLPLQQHARRNVGCFGESVSAVMPKQY